MSHEPARVGPLRSPRKHVLARGGVGVRPGHEVLVEALPRPLEAHQEPPTTLQQQPSHPIRRQFPPSVLQKGHYVVDPEQEDWLLAQEQNYSAVLWLTTINQGTAWQQIALD